MILGFSTQLNGKPTFFVEKIHSGLILNDLMNGFDAEFANKDFSMDAFAEKHMKLHTIREDPKDRWKRGNKIDFFINVRKKDMFRFAPVLPVTSTQKITILWYRLGCNAFPGHKYTYKNRNVRVYIDGLAMRKEVVIELAQNDGFDTTDDFFEYFSENFTGKLIHWTDKLY